MIFRVRILLQTDCSRREEAVNEVEAGQSQASDGWIQWGLDRQLARDEIERIGCQIRSIVKCKAGGKDIGRKGQSEKRGEGTDKGDRMLGVKRQVPCDGNTKN